MNCKVLLPFVLLVFISVGIYAQCNSTQIDINSADATELDKLYGIGPAKAQNIISYRSMNEFNSVDDLINVSGIGSITLENIKSQGLACVNLENNSSQSTQNVSVPNPEKDFTNSESPTSTVTSSAIVIEQDSKSQTPTTPKVIELSHNPTNSSVNPAGIFNSMNLPLYGLVAFGVLVGALFMARKLKTKRYKSEFN